MDRHTPVKTVPSPSFASLWVVATLCAPLSLLDVQMAFLDYSLQTISKGHMYKHTELDQQIEPYNLGRTDYN